MDSNLIVYLRLYKGSRILKDEEGNITNENQIYKVMYDSKMWDIAIRQRNLKNEYGVITLEKVVDKDGNKITDFDIEKGKTVNIEDLVKADLKEMLVGTDIPLTEDQKRIKELEEKIEKLMGNSKKEVSDIDKIRAEYESLYGEKPHHKKTAEQLSSLIEEFNIKNK